MSPETTFTVGEIAERLSRVTGQSAAYHARQLRHWAALGLFPDARFPLGAGPTAAREFVEAHLFQALIFTLLSGQGVTADQLAHVRGCFQNSSHPAFMEPVEGGFAGYSGLRGAMEWRNQHPEDAIYFYVYASVGGDVAAGAFTRKPDIEGLLTVPYPIITVLRLDHLMDLVLAD